MDITHTPDSGITPSNSLQIKKLFSDSVKKQVVLKLSPVAIPISAIQEALFEGDTLLLEYLKGEEFESESTCIEIESEASCGG